MVTSQDCTVHVGNVQRLTKHQYSWQSHHVPNTGQSELPWGSITVLYAQQQAEGCTQVVRYCSDTVCWHAAIQDSYILQVTCIRCCLQATCNNFCHHVLNHMPNQHAKPHKLSKQLCISDMSKKQEQRWCGGGSRVSSVRQR